MAGYRSYGRGVLFLGSNCWRSTIPRANWCSTLKIARFHSNMSLASLLVAAFVTMVSLGLLCCRHTWSCRVLNGWSSLSCPILALIWQVDIKLVESVSRARHTFPGHDVRLLAPVKDQVWRLCESVNQAKQSYVSYMQVICRAMQAHPVQVPSPKRQQQPPRPAHAAGVQQVLSRTSVAV